MKYITVLVLFFFGMVCTAQTPDYCVYLVTGNATIKAGNKRPVKLTRNAVVYKDQSIFLSNNAKVTLVNKDADYLVLNAAGEYKVADLHKNITKQPPGVTKKYFGVLWSQMVKSASSYEELLKSNKGGVMGGVTRGNDDCIAIIFPAGGLKTAADSFAVIWNRPDEDEEYLFNLYDNAGNQIIKQTVKDTQIIISLSAQLDGRQGKYFFKVSGKRFRACTSDATTLEITTRESELKLRLANTMASLNSEDFTVQLDFIDSLIKEKRTLLAAEIYKELVQKNAGDSFLSKSYLVFLTNYGFNKEAEAFSKTIIF